MQGGCKLDVMIKHRVINELMFLLKMIIAFGIGVLIVFGASHLLGGVLAEKELEMALNQQEISKAMLELIGMQQLAQFPASIEVFFLLVLVLNLIVVCVIIAHSVHAMRRNLEQGAFGFLFVQVTKKHIYFIIELLRTLVVAFCTWGFYVVALFVTAAFLLSDAELLVADKVYEILSTMSIWGIAIVLLFVAIAVLYGIVQGYRMHQVDFGLAIIGVGFVIGNAYKIPQYIGQKQIEQMVNAQETMEIMRMMKTLRIACPFSWLNPYNIYNHVLDAGILWIYVAVALLVFAIAGAVFCLRDWWEV